MTSAGLLIGIIITCSEHIEIRFTLCLDHTEFKFLNFIQSFHNFKKSYFQISLCFKISHIFFENTCIKLLVFVYFPKAKY